MSDNRLSEFIKNPDSVKEYDIFYLKALVKKYPFFPIGHVLLLNAYNKFDKENFDLQLRESALCVPDRKKLFNLIYNVKVNTSRTVNENTESPKTVPVETVQSGEEPVEFQFDNTKAEITINEPVDVNLTNASVKSDLLDFDNTFSSETENEVLSQNNNQDSEVNTTSGAGFTLIDRFIEESPVFTPNRLDLTDQHEDISIPSLQEDENLVSETLATIFETQKLYEKAISIYEKLILKFPEKSTYFASRIDDLKTKL